MARRDENVAVLNRPVGDAVRPREDDEDMDTGADTDTEQEDGTETAPTPASAPKAVKRNANDLPDDEVISLNIRVPNGLRKQLAQTASDQQTSIPQLVAGMLASAYDFELPKATRAPRLKKYANKEERLAAQKAQQQKNRQITRAILSAVEAGKLDVDIDALLAEMQSAEAEAAAS